MGGKAPRPAATRPTLAAFCLTALLALGWLAGCADGYGSSVDSRMHREQAGGVVAGVVLKEPVSLEGAYGIGSDLLGDPIALYRSDYVCVRKDAPSAGEMQPVPSRFAYTEAFHIERREFHGIKARETTATVPSDGVRSRWLHWEDQWVHAQAAHVRFEALALYLREAGM